MTIRNLLDQAEWRRGGAAFLVSAETGEEVGIAGLRGVAAAVESLLAGLEVPPGEPVPFLLDNGLFTAQLLLGIMAGGRVALPLSPAAGEAHVGHALAHSGARVLFAGAEHEHLCRAACARAGGTIHVLPADPESGLAPRMEAAAPVARADPSDGSPAALFYTSGTTGVPKGALLTHGGLCAGAAALAEAHQLTARDRSYCVLPLYHLNALVSTLLPALLSGGTVVVARRFTPGGFWPHVRRYRCTWTGLVPTVVARLLDSPGPGAPLRFARCSSAPLETSRQRAFEERFGVPLIEAMGLTEAGSTVFAQPLPPAPRKAGSVGLPVGVEVRLVDPDRRDLPDETAGEILLRGPSVMAGYFRDPEATAAALDPDGWLATGDQARRDHDGHYFVTGRLKEIIVKAGVNVSPREIELALSRHPAVRESAAVGVPDPHLGQDILAYVVLARGAAPEDGELYRLCAAELGEFKTPTEIIVVGELPRGPTGKLQRFRLAGRPRAAPAAIDLAVRTVWAEVLGVDTVPGDPDFFELGGDSLRATLVLGRLRQWLGIELPLSALFEAPTVSALSARIMGQVSVARPERSMSP